MRRAKIVCTIGPATSSPEQLTALVRAGMDVARLNLSHGTHETHEEVFGRLRVAAERGDRNVGVLADLQGPKIRLGTFATGPVRLETGDRFVITTEDVEGNHDICSTTYQGLAADVRPGLRILVDDGRVGLQVVAVDGPRVVTQVVEGGMVSDHKGINVPGAALSVPALTHKDVEDLRWALRLGVDMIALSFVRSPKDLDAVREIMAEEAIQLPVLAKIEKPQAVDALEEIVAAFDGVMVARGDLGVELPLWDVPLVQKRAVTLAREAGKPVIVATQMLESMISASRPTRAEASDVANAILDGADAVMLSGETSVGRYPVQAVETMAHIISTVETDALDKLPRLTSRPASTAGALTRSATVVGDLVGAKFLVAFTQTGDSARRLARHRSGIRMLAMTPDPKVRRQLALSWGVQAYLVEPVSHTDEMYRQVDQTLLAMDAAQPGDYVVVVAGTPPGVPGSTNSMRVHRVGGD